ncbi:MAG: hypothetical protein C4519_21300 [Desulfobacteraceae bacterium]|nr:MAG: hypothetical protein C4519_21300 [Desulfobacteraceae bacterium]
MVAALVVVPTGIMAAGQVDYRDTQIEAGSMAADALVARPLGVIATLAGFGLFVISAPFSLLGGNAGSAWSSLVVDPAKFTFTRPLGDFD